MKKYQFLSYNSSMSLKGKHGETEFGVGDTIRLYLKTKEGDKTRKQVFEGMVIGIKGRGPGKSFTLRRIGSQKIGIERIFPLAATIIEKLEVVRRGTRGVRRAKLYYTRKISKREVEKIYTRSKHREEAKKK